MFSSSSVCLAILCVLLFIRLKSERYDIFVLKLAISQQTLLLKDVNISIESHFVGVHGPYELHRKEKQIFMHR